MRLTAARRLSHAAARMALYQPPSAKDKLIFAPAGNQTTGQADQFTLSTLSLADLDRTSPIRQFHAWFAHAQSAGAVPHPEACSLSTAQLPSGRVSSRMVYLKELEAEKKKKTTGGKDDDDDDENTTPGFVIYTNTEHSRKAADLASNPHASLLFFWEPLQRQVRVEGRVSRLTRDESQRYFDTRARGSRIGAWASRQSHVLEPRRGGGSGGEEEAKEEEQQQEEDDGRAQLEGWVREAEEKFAGEDKIPVPEFWGGLRIVPERVEFWQGRDSRLHDRFVYEKEGEGWTVSRLSP